ACARQRWMPFIAPRFTALACTAGLACTFAVAAMAQDLQSCRNVAQDAARLACYDALAGAPAAPSGGAQGAAASGSRAAQGSAAPASTPQATGAPSGRTAAAPSAKLAVATSNLEQQWELRPDLRHGVLNL